MWIRQAVWEYSAYRVQDLRPGTGPEIAFVGRSNAGKSSVINCLVGWRLARVGKRPGHTPALNFYRIDTHCYWVDFPGYGYAQRSQVERGRWRRLAESYFRHRPSLRGIILVMDSRHAPTPLDELLVQWLAPFGYPGIGVLNKVDLLGPAERAVLERRMATWPARWRFVAVIPFSARTGEGRPTLLSWIQKLCFEGPR
ncbi:MAG: ribosome biogenesis GTP-binding protein YihA/YsxC [Acidobacteria bacterium]|nr:ribosome biogenesis GTP-binding protein YihA/YsxC [Acidobacteriota bacterium]MDW7983649.1 ribosome biogenesis GTP-binding protein YihA/YsxC [Acidobacteriota bacterium]